jgi:hypothetical protein
MKRLGLGNFAPSGYFWKGEAYFAALELFSAWGGMGFRHFWGRRLDCGRALAPA